MAMGTVLGTRHNSASGGSFSGVGEGGLYSGTTAGKVYSHEYSKWRKRPLGAFLRENLLSVLGDATNQEKRVLLNLT
jgi:hypothetical protein